MSRDEITLGYAGDERLWSDRGGRLITFKDWLIANRGNGQARQQEEWERNEKRSGVNSVVESSNFDDGNHNKHGPNGRRRVEGFNHDNAREKQKRQSTCP